MPGRLKNEGDGLSWVVELEPYDLAAVAFSEPDVKLLQPQAVAGGQCCRVDRAADPPTRRAGRRPPQSAAHEGPGKPRLPKQAQRSRSRARLGRLQAAGSFDHHRHHAGTRDRSCDREGSQAGAVGQDLQRRADRLPGKPAVRPARTGRITMSVWLRVADAARQPNLRLAVEGKLVGRDYYRYAVIGQPPGPGRRQAASPRPGASTSCSSTICRWTAFPRCGCVWI